MTLRIELKVGLFLAIATLLLLAAIGYVAYQKGVFSKDYTYTLSSTTGENLTEGMPVVFWGFRIGRVSAMELTERGVLIRIKVPERHNRVIRADSKFVLDKPLIGSPRIVVDTSNIDGPPLSPNFVPELTVSNDINELIKQVKPIATKIDEIAANVIRITANLADPGGHVNRILAEAETITSRFAKKESILEMLVSNPESIQSIHTSLIQFKEITQRVDDILEKVDGLAQRADGLAEKGGEEIYGREGVLPLVRDILRDLIGKLAKLDTALINVNLITGEAADAAKDLKVLRKELDAAVIAIGSLADELDRKIPFKARPEIKLP
jgi:phospholipid/cholesterol/gamma-HCH transport system substrate-binding protein